MQEYMRKFHLYERPWLALVAVMVTIVLSAILTGIVVHLLIKIPFESTTGQFLELISYHILTVFLITPFILHLPMGRRTYRQYLDDIQLSNIQPFFRLILLGVSCYGILALSQISATIVYRFFEGLPINMNFIQSNIDILGDLNLQGLLLSTGSIFEEMEFRGIILAVFLCNYSKRESIIYSSVGFGVFHLLNLIHGFDLVWVIGNVVWAFTLGLFYGYIVIKTKSLLPPMIVHYLGNLFISSLTGYIQINASSEIQALYGVVLTFGFIPVALMILWTRFFSSRWLTSVESKTAKSTSVYV
jgi:membrane protease YdiL (CAAX protease family)